LHGIAESKRAESLSVRKEEAFAHESELPKSGVKPYFAADGLDFETRGRRLSANLQPTCVI
jgi:hypothetical protein